jgi:hypothetical protein
MGITTETYAYGYRTKTQAELAIIDQMESDFLSRADRPRVAAYRAKDGRKLYRILIDVDHGHYDPTTDIAYC